MRISSLPFAFAVFAVAACSSGVGSSSQSVSCDPNDPAACGGPSGGSVCVAHSTGDAPGCEQVGEPNADAPDLGCWACRTDSDCTTSGGCLAGSCRQATGYDFVKQSTVVADDTALGARCCAAGHVKCSPASGGNENCSCEP